MDCSFKQLIHVFAFLLKGKKRFRVKGHFNLCDYRVKPVDDFTKYGITSKYGIEIYPLQFDGDLKRKVFLMLCPSDAEREKWLKSFEGAFAELSGGKEKTQEEAGVFSISGNSELAIQQIRLLNVRHRIENFTKIFGNNFSEKCLEEGLHSSLSHTLLSILLLFPMIFIV